MNGVKKGRDVPASKFLRFFEVSIAEHRDAAAFLRWKRDLKTVCFKNMNGGLAYIDLVGVGVTAVEVSNLFVSNAWGDCFGRFLPTAGRHPSQWQCGTVFRNGV